MEKFDLVVIGAGPGGYVAAIRSAQLGMKVAVIEKRKGLGGTCLNVGCIPSKALLDSSELYHQAKASFATHGIDVPDVGLNFEQMMKRKEDVVNTTVGGIDYLFKKNGITRFEGLGSFVDANTIHISGEQDLDIQADKVLIATGSEPTELPFLKFDGENIISSTEALSLKEVPKHLIVVGGGVIGLEIGSVYKRLGADVTVVEFLPKIVPSMDEEIGKQLQKSLQKLKVKFKLSHGVTGATVTEDGVLVQAKDKKGKEVEFKGDKVLVAVGRRANTV